MGHHKMLQSMQLSLLFTEYCELDSSWNYKNILSPFSRLYLITDGSGEIFFNNKKMDLFPGNLYLIPSFCKHSVRCFDFINQYYICFTEKLESGIGLYDFLKFRNQQIANPLDYMLIKRFLELNPNMQLPVYDPVKYDNSRVIYSKQEVVNDQTDKDFIESHSIMIQMLSRFVDAQTTTGAEKRMAMIRMSKILQYINNNLNQNMTMKELGNVMFLSPEYLSRLFRKTMGESPIEYIVRKRIEKAQELLFSSNDGIRNISEQCGFNNLSNFNKMFKRITSMQPSEYRNRLVKLN